MYAQLQKFSDYRDIIQIRRSNLYCHSNKKMDDRKYIIQEINIEESVEDFPLPPPNLQLKFKNISEWLGNRKP